MTNELSEYNAKDRMLLADVNILALKLMQDHGLIEQGWFFSWDRAKKRLGVCQHRNKMILMSKYLTTQRTYEQCRNTILHEIAHALVGPGHGHSAVWEMKALEIGCDGQRCGALPEDAEPIAARWTGRCSSCERTQQFHRAPVRVRSCGSCSPGVFSWETVIDWYDSRGVMVNHFNMPSTRYVSEYQTLFHRYENVMLGS